MSGGIDMGFVCRQRKATDNPRTNGKMDGQTITDVHSISPQGKEVKPMQVNQAIAKKLIKG